MDILIKNLEKPKNCLKCQFYTSEYDYCHALKDNLSQKEWETKSRCPLVELPPHGDLIDRNELSIIGITDYKLEGHTVVEFEDVLNAPVIVEASNGTDN